MIRGGICKTALLDFLTGVHTPKDSYYMALVGEKADCDTGLVTFTGQGEVTGQGYKSGGKALTGYHSGVDEDVAFISWDDIEWPNVTVSAAGAVIYNRTRGNRALAILDFGGEKSSSNGPFRVNLAAPGQYVIWLS